MKPQENSKRIKLNHLNIGNLGPKLLSTCLAVTVLTSFSFAQVSGNNSLPKPIITPTPISQASQNPLIPLLKVLAPPKITSKSYSWSLNGLKEFDSLMTHVSQDLEYFFVNNPDFVADTFGGSASNAWGSFKKTLNGLINSPVASAQFAKDYLLWWLFSVGNQPAPNVGVEAELCKTPRVCQSMQYLVSNSLLKNWDPLKSSLAFYPASSSQGEHSFIVALPNGIPATPENVRAQGFIIDPYFSQSSDPAKFLRLGNDKAYTNLQVTPYKVKRDDLVVMFGKDPLNVENEGEETTSNPPPPPQTPTSTNPPTVPVPPPNPIFCDTYPWARNPDGTEIFVLDKNGNRHPVVAQEMYATSLVFKDQEGTIKLQMTLSSVVKCDWEKNRTQYLEAAMQTLNILRGRGEFYNCVATHIVPAGHTSAYGPREMPLNIEKCID